MNTAIVTGGIDNPQQFQNVGECIKTTEYYSQTVYQNVCDGTSYVVQNGFWDYAGLWILVGMGVGICIFFLLVVLRLALD